MSVCFLFGLKPYGSAVTPLFQPLLHRRVNWQLTKYADSPNFHLTPSPNMVLLRDSLSLLPLALPLLSLPLAAADDCQPVTWTKIRNKARDVATGAAASPPAATELAAAADFQVPGTHEPYLVRRDPATIQPGDFVCRLWIESDEEVNYWTCSDMAARFQLTREQFFEMNPNLLPDCSNIEPETDYCVRGCMSMFSFLVLVVLRLLG